MLIYEKHTHEFDYLKINLLFPVLNINKKEKDELSEIQKVTRLSLETAIVYVKHRIFRSFKLRILGFGFSIIRQTGY